MYITVTWTTKYKVKVINIIVALPNMKHIIQQGDQLVQDNGSSGETFRWFVLQMYLISNPAKTYFFSL